MKHKELYFLKGERKYIQFEIISTIKQKVVINQASYELTNHNDEIVESGSCEIVDDCILQVLIDADDVGSYDLEITYTIAPEIRKVRCQINVH